MGRAVHTHGYMPRLQRGTGTSHGIGHKKKRPGGEKTGRFPPKRQGAQCPELLPPGPLCFRVRMSVVIADCMDKYAFLMN